MQTILVSGGNSGIGLQAVREFVARGHRVIILGQDQRKGEAAVASLGEAAKQVTFFSVDLSTHEGVRKAAQVVLSVTDRLDAVLHASGVLLTKDVRTADDLNLYFAVNCLSRYHLTQLLLPALRKSDKARVVMMTAKVDLSTPTDFRRFPRFDSFSFKDNDAASIGNHHFAAYLARTEPQLLAGIVNAGMAKTGIMRHSPWYMRAVSAMVAPLIFNSVEESARNAVQACLRTDWDSATYWEYPGKFDLRTPIRLDESVTRRMMTVFIEITGV